jgi:3-deoxy-7-phosphoheptulonate synthase
MILILHPDTDKNSNDYRQLLDFLSNLHDIKLRLHDEQGTQQTLTEIYLVGDTASLQIDEMASLPCVERVVRVSEEYRVLGRHHDDDRPTWFEYNGIRCARWIPRRM